MALCVFVMISGVLFFGYIIASIAANLANADTARTNFQQKINAIKNFMDVSKRYTSFCQAFQSFIASHTLLGTSYVSFTANLLLETQQQQL